MRSLDTCLRKSALRKYRSFYAFRLVAIAFGLMVILGSGHSHASKAINWKKVGGWDIRVDPSLSNGCFLLASYVTGTVFRFGFDMGTGNAYFLIANANWKSIEEGKSYKLVFQFDERPEWTGEGTSKKFGDDLTALVGSVSDTVFFNELARSHVLSASYKRREIARLALKGSYAAVRELIKCQAEMRAAGGTDRRASKDPFASGRAEAKAKDPFAQ